MQKTFFKLFFFSWSFLLTGCGSPERWDQLSAPEKREFADSLVSEIQSTLPFDHAQHLVNSGMLLFDHHDDICKDGCQHGEKCAADCTGGDVAICVFSAIFG